MRRALKSIEIGKKIGRLTIISEGNRKITPSGKSLRTANCLCECGNTANILLDTLNSKRPTESCGCINVERSKVENKKHGLKNHTLYRKWYGMKTRCFNTNYHNYDRYGKRGITVCDEWLNSFEAFYKWAINNGFEEDLEIDRIDTDGNYEPLNCRFVTSKINNRNRSVSKLTREDVLDIRNTKLLIPSLQHKEIALGYGIHKSTVGQILRNEIWGEI